MEGKCGMRIKCYAYAQCTLSCWIPNLSCKGPENSSLDPGNPSYPTSAILISPQMTSYSMGKRGLGRSLLESKASKWREKSSARRRWNTWVVFRFFPKHINNAWTTWGFLNANIRLTVDFKFSKLCFGQATNFGSWMEIGHTMTRL